MATEYERIDNLMKAIAGLISPHIDCNADASILEDHDIADMESRIEDLEQSGYLEQDEIYEHIKGNVKTLISTEVEDLDFLAGDDVDEKINDWFMYSGGYDNIEDNVRETCRDEVRDEIQQWVREEVQSQLTPERLVSMFIEGLSEAINGNKTGRYTVTVRDEAA